MFIHRGAHVNPGGGDLWRGRGRQSAGAAGGARAATTQRR